jgi:HK97 family phage major capsid protein
MDPKTKAPEDMGIRKKLLRQISAEDHSRAVSIEREAIDEEARTVTLAFSSETPVERWFGDEILDHDPSSVRLERLLDGGPLLVDHDTRDHIGTVEKAWVDSDRVCRAVVRFGKSSRAEEIWQDVLDLIRKKVSIWYRIHNARPEELGEDGEPLSYRVIDWEPFEISFVSVPADNSVGVGRSKSGKMPDQEFSINQESDSSQESRNSEVVTMPPIEENKQAIESARAAGEQAAAARIAEVLQAGEQYADQGGNEVARKVVDAGGNIEDFNREMLQHSAQSRQATEAESPEIDLTEKEARNYSFVRAMNALANPQDRRAREAAAFEMECSSAAQDKMRKESRGFLVPADVLRMALVQGQRDLTVGTATAGGHTVATDLMAMSFIELLRNRARVLPRATMLNDLNGNIAIPRMTGGATAYWVGEGSDITESQQSFDQVAMSPETVGAFTEFSRKLLIQSSIDVEAMVRRDLATVLALELDRVAINGSGSSNEPTGILQTAGIGSVVGGTNGAAPDWDDIVDLETEVAVDNADVGDLAYVTNAKVRGKLKKTFVDSGSNAERVWDIRAGDTPLNGYAGITTNQVPDDLDKGTATGVCSAILFGNWADLIVALWGGLDIQVNPYANDKNGGVRVTAFQDADVAPRHAQSFAAMKDALTS